ncbi:hypothetical protein C5167_035656 [Papaver somniferum]|uniref:Uncharacterized protein n=1 Tax=Papaver somniferum TaxID=3469 RepID=A0A4Y7KE68_PAPSO|nr:hypothetical protein C5167_035656 [Papaver somniferum]
MSSSPSDVFGVPSEDELAARLNLRITTEARHDLITNLMQSWHLEKSRPILGFANDTNPSMEKKDHGPIVVGGTEEEDKGDKEKFSRTKVTEGSGVEDEELDSESH